MEDGKLYDENGREIVVVRNKYDQAADDLDGCGALLQGCGGVISGCGCLLTIFVTVPLILFFLWLLF